MKREAELSRWSSQVLTSRSTLPGTYVVQTRSCMPATHSYATNFRRLSEISVEALTVCENDPHWRQEIVASMFALSVFARIKHAEVIGGHRFEGDAMESGRLCDAIDVDEIANAPTWVPRFETAVEFLVARRCMLSISLEGSV